VMLLCYFYWWLVVPKYTSYETGSPSGLIHSDHVISESTSTFVAPSPGVGDVGVFGGLFGDCVVNIPFSTFGCIPLRIP